MRRTELRVPRDVDAEDHCLAIYLHVQSPCKAWRRGVSPTTCREAVTAADFADSLFAWLWDEIGADWVERIPELHAEANRLCLDTDLTWTLEQIGTRIDPGLTWCHWPYWARRLRKTAHRRRVYLESQRKLEWVRGG